ncbi:MAG: hypothetical protein O3C22_06115 [Bacteroidetes bacterium]|nr:hypothetical protein [Bacteroidota bacterium]MDA0943833.1 hypothetical protein [Bacteroidota bacterium]MDA1112344.1 hypothetical protein [Bacteroidota bacterium]
MHQLIIKVGTLLALVSLFSCSSNRIQYLTIPHEEVMSEYNTRQKVFLEFGSPDNQTTIDSITSFTYNMGSVSWISGSTISTGTYGSITNPLYRPLANPIVSSTRFISTTNVLAKSTTVNSYAKFWIMGDSVMKWETQGIDRSRKIPISSQLADTLYPQSRGNNSYVINSQPSSTNETFKSQTLPIMTFVLILATLRIIAN